MIFTLGEYYSRKAIHEGIGGGQAQHFLSQKDGKIIAAFYDSVINPGGPQTIQVGKGDVMIAKSRLLAEQEEAIPVFRKADVKGSNAGKYEYVGLYRCTGLLEDAETIAAEEARSNRPDTVAVVLKLQYVSA